MKVGVASAGEDAIVDTVAGFRLTLKVGIVGVHGDLVNLNLFNVFTSAIKFAPSQYDIDIDLDGDDLVEDLDNAELLTLGLSSNEHGIATRSFSLQLAPAAPA